ncbi:MAG: n-acetylglutamate synthase [Candidatus Zixiibacteriota bacterium]|nr:MAG: n-acetylglutamate synthase [candidate division Zixibacteria bacterium]
MTGIDYNDKYFVGVMNYDDGDLTRDTVYHYRQKGDIVWGSFEGGNCRHGNFVARVLDDGNLDMVWQYLNKEGKLVSGGCRSTPEMLPDGRIRLHESWHVHGTEVSGTSAVEQVAGVERG